MAETKSAVKEKKERPESKREVGKTTGKGIVGSWIEALTTGFKEKWDATKILGFMQKEFPGKTNLCSVGTARGHYNRGAYTHTDGKPVPPKTQVARHGESPRKAKAKAKAEAAPKKKVVAVKS